MNVNAMNWKDLFLSFEGRIGRKHYWIGMLSLALMSFVFGIIGAVLGVIFAPLALIMTAASLALIYPSCAVATKRWHDRGKSGWWTLVAFVPLVGGLYMLWECGIQPAAPEGDAYGTNPVPAAA